MPKVTVEYNLPEERDDYNIHMQSFKMYCALSDFSEYLRAKVKYSPEGGDIFYEIRIKFYEILSECDVNLDSL